MHQPQKSNPQRIRHPNIRPLEISDVWVAGSTLWDWSRAPGFASVLRRALERWRDNDCANPWNEAAPAGLQGFDAVFVAGGRAEDDLLRTELSALPCAVVFGEEPLFGGERGGFELLQSRNLSGWVADLGKSQLKLSAPGWRWNFPRDWTRLRPPWEASKIEIPAQRRRLREFIALKFQAAMAESGLRPQSLVFALPCPVDDDGTPAPSSYVGMGGDGALLRDAMALAGLPDLPLLVLNDAELAALSAHSDARLAGFRKVLVLTLGFGIGAALIQVRSVDSFVRANSG